MESEFETTFEKVTVQVTMVVLVPSGHNAGEIAQRWLPHLRELPLGCSDGAQLTAIAISPSPENLRV